MLSGACESFPEKTVEAISYPDWSFMLDIAKSQLQSQESIKAWIRSHLASVSRVDSADSLKDSQAFWCMGSVLPGTPNPFSVLVPQESEAKYT